MHTIGTHLGFPGSGIPCAPPLSATPPCLLAVPSSSSSSPSGCSSRSHPAFRSKQLRRLSPSSMRAQSQSDIQQKQPQPNKPSTPTLVVFWTNGGVFETKTDGRLTEMYENRQLKSEAGPIKTGAAGSEDIERHPRVGKPFGSTGLLRVHPSFLQREYCCAGEQ